MLPKARCPSWSENANNYVTFTAEEDSLGQVITTLWIHTQAMNLSCNLDPKVAPKDIKIEIEYEEVEGARSVANKCVQSLQVSDEDEINRKDFFPVILRGTQTTPTLSNNVKTTSKPNISRTTNTKQCQSRADTIIELSSKGALQGNPFLLKRWREYFIKVIIEDEEKRQSEELILQHNTFLWTCPEKTCQKIVQKQLCDGNNDCPFGSDEDPNTCSVSQLPQKLAYSLYGYMVLLIAIFWMFLGSQKPALMTPDILQFDLKGFPDKDRYVNQHKDSKISHSQDVLEHTYGNIFNINCHHEREICQEVRDGEIEIHKNAKETYNCILEHYSGDHPLTARLANPSGGLLGKTKRLVNQNVNHGTRWYGLSIISRFVLLCLFHFDYIKDIGKSCTMCIAHDTYIHRYQFADINFRYRCDNRALRSSSCSIQVRARALLRLQLPIPLLHFCLSHLCKSSCHFPLLDCKTRLRS